VILSSAIWLRAKSIFGTAYIGKKNENSTRPYRKIYRFDRTIDLIESDRSIILSLYNSINLAFVKTPA